MWKFLCLFVMIFSSFGFSQNGPENCISKVSSGFGPVKSCSSGEGYHVVLKSQCKSAVDLVCGVQEKSGEWKIFSKYGLLSNDTILAYSCDGSGKYQYWVRYVGDTSHLPTYEDLNPNKSKVLLIDLFARLLYGSAKKPVENQKVDLVNSRGETIQSSVTDKSGNFSFKKIPESERFEVYVGDVEFSPEEKLFLAKQNGSILSELRIVKGRGYRYSLLPADLITLSEIEVTDPTLALNLFKEKAGKMFNFSKRINYPSNLIEPSNIKELDVVLEFLKDNPVYDLKIISHTDSKGDDKSNLELSLKRSDFVKMYFIRNGISVNRLNAIGKGETEILNHCLNGVPCSEDEHGVNRRTEFVFYINK